MPSNKEGVIHGSRTSQPVPVVSDHVERKDGKTYSVPPRLTPRILSTPAKSSALGPQAALFRFTGAAKIVGAHMPIKRVVMSARRGAMTLKSSSGTGACERAKKVEIQDRIRILTVPVEMAEVTETSHLQTRKRAICMNGTAIPDCRYEFRIDGVRILRVGESNRKQATGID
jgi:hypothetical protein